MSVDTKVQALGEGSFALIVNCFDQKILNQFNELGFEGNGYTWCGVVESTARLILGKEAGSLSHSPEADSAMVTSPDKAILDKLAAGVQRAFTDPEFMKTVIDNADPDYLE